MTILKKFNETFLQVVVPMISEDPGAVISILPDEPVLRTVAVIITTTSTMGTHAAAAEIDAVMIETEAPREVCSQIFISQAFIRLTLCKGGRSNHSDYSDSESDSPPRRGGRRKSLGEQALAAIGLGGIAGGASGGGQRNRSRSRGGRHRRSYSSSRSRSRGPDRSGKIQQAVQAALTAGAVEAFRTRKEPGPWTGEKGKRVLTAAIGAGGIDGLADHDPNKHSTLHTVEAVIGGLASNRLVNGPRSRSRSRSRGRGGGGGGGGGGSGIKELAAGGLAAAAGKAFLDHRNRSKSRGQRRSYSSSEDSRSPPRNRNRNRNKRSKSVTGYIDKGIDKGLTALGLRESDKGRDDSGDRYSSRRSGNYDDGYSQSRGMPREDVARMRGGGSEDRRGSSSSNSNSSDDMSSTEEEREHRKMRGKELLTAGLATVATIHAGHGVYESFEDAQKRHKAVKEGKLSKKEARALKTKAAFQDVAAVGIAALGIKSAVDEWKGMKEKRDQCHEFDQKRQQRKQRRSQRGSNNGRPSYRGSDPSYRNSAPNLYSKYQNGNSNGYGEGPMYQDGNPYTAGGLPPPPPMGPPPARY